MTISIVRRFAIVFFLLLVLLSSESFAQINGMLGMEWGASRDQVIATLAARPGAVFNPKPVDSTTVVFNAGNYGVDSVSFVLASLGSKGFYSGSIVLELIPSDEARNAQFERIKQQITAEYGIEPTLRDKPDELVGWQWDTPMERTSLTISRSTLAVSMTYFTVNPLYRD